MVWTVSFRRIAWILAAFAGRKRFYSVLRHNTDSLPYSAIQLVPINLWPLSHVLRRRFHEIPDRPEIPFDSRCHRGSAAQGIMPLHEIVIGEVERNRCLEVLPLLAESVREASQAAHVEAGCAVQTLNVTRGCQRHIRKTSDGFLFRYDKLWGAVLTFRSAHDLPS